MKSFIKIYLQKKKKPKTKWVSDFVKFTIKTFFMINRSDNYIDRKNV